MTTASSAKPFTEVLTLSTGRRVAVESYGDPQGAPVFFFHGWPNSRLQGELGHQGACEAGMRLLAVDRPGIGGSDYHADRTLLDWPPLLAEIADQLKYDTFRVLGVSGGGPYALAAAWALPERVIAAGICCGAPPLSEMEDASGLLPVYRFLLRQYRRYPDMMRRGFRLARPFATLRPPPWLFRLMVKTLPKPDADALGSLDSLDLKWAGYAGAWSGDRDGIFGDARIYAQPWGFRPEEIRVPVRLWHGRKDANFRWPLAEELAARIPGCTARFIDNEGHYSLAFRWCGEILRDLSTVPAGMPAGNGGV